MDNSNAEKQTGAAQNQVVVVTGISNREFLEQYARPGRVGLCGGSTLVDKAILRAERHIDPLGEWGAWSHAFLFQGSRHDGHHWVIESDIQINRKHIRLGVQENRIAKYFDENFYTTLAVLDFALPETSVAKLLHEGLELVAARTRYSLRELIGTLIALREPKLRAKENLLARESSIYCSAFVQHLFGKAGLDLVPGIAGKNTTPEDISRTSVPHVTYILRREQPEKKSGGLKARLHGRVRARIDKVKELRKKRKGV
ncbi:MAG TPA: hypothetical protein VH413_06265 [Verrucomicrobiae bacterium]|nr:hypothetical protein [Verrucomicrobiae bacterium]